MYPYLMRRSDCFVYVRLSYKGFVSVACKGHARAHILVFKLIFFSASAPGHGSRALASRFTNNYKWVESTQTLLCAVDFIFTRRRVRERYARRVGHEESPPPAAQN
ncbi:unnamed protein product, partial [Brenthis ino]